MHCNDDDDNDDLFRLRRQVPDDEISKAPLANEAETSRVALACGVI